MTGAELVERLRRSGVEIRGEEGQLRLRAPKGVLTEEVRALLSERKQEILDHLERSEEPRASAPDVIPRRGVGSGPVRQSFAQQRLWFLDQVESGSAVYNMAPAFRLRGPLDADALGRCLTTILRRHDVLRTRLASSDGTPVQLVRDDAAISMTLEDLRGQPASERAARARRILSERAAQPFDLAEDLLVRASLVRLGDDDHILGLVVHHAVFDGWSTGVLLREIKALYPSLVSGQPSPLADLSLQYADYSEWQRDWLEGGELERQLSYWLDRLDGATTTLELPVDKPRPAVFTGRGSTVSWTVEPSVVRGFSELARSEGATLFMGMLAAYAVLLHRYSGETDILVGSPVANRTRRELEDLVGLFANTLVLRVDLSGDPTFRDVLRRVREACVGAYAHADMPFERLVQELNPARDMSRTPLFQVMMALEDTGPDEVAIGDLAVERFALEEAVARTDLSLWLRPGNGGLEGSLEYNVDLFDAATVERLLRSFDVVLAEALQRPDQPVRSISVLADADRDTMLNAWNETSTEIAWDTAVHAIAHRAARHPDRIAVTGRSGSLTSAELWRRAGHLARAIRSRGIEPGSVVGLSLKRSPDMVVALLGIWRSGTAYLPLDPDFPTSRLQFMVEDSGTSLVVVDASADAPWAHETISLSALEEEGRGRPSDPGEDAAPAPDMLAYLLYTSGSTGKPKGVLVSHGNLANFLGSMEREPGMGEDDVLLAVTTLSFDISCLELWLPLWTGARVEIADEDDTRDARRLAARLDETGATVMQATPSTWRMLLDAGWAGRLDTILCGGEPFPRDLVTALLERGARVWNLYGPTETTIWSTLHRVTGSSGGPVPIGRPIANTKVYVMDEAGRPVPQGVTGELWISGRGVARGYHARADLTDERFVPHPFDGGGQAYRTGDLVRWRTDGTLDHLGRLDHQVKVHGYRIELGEIEAVLAGHDGVAQAVAVVEGEGGDARLTAFVVSSTGRPLIGSEIRRFARRSLPNYMVPGMITEVDRLPLTPNGKIDRKALVRLGTSSARAVSVPPTTPAEAIVADIWRSLLEVDDISIHDNFFELGGHSLLAIRMVDMIQKRTGARVDPRELFFQSLAQISASLGGVHETTSGDP